MTTKERPIPLQYHDLQNTREWAACELANAAGILVGVGALPLLRDRLGSLFWLAEAAAAVVMITTGLYFLERGVPRLVVLLRRLPSAFRRLADFWRSLLALFHRAWKWISLRLPWQRKAAPAPVVPGAPARKENPLGEAAPVAAGEPSPDHVIVLLPYLTLSIGIFTLLPAVLAASLQRWGVGGGYVAAVYFSAPALLAWMIGELAYLLPKMAVSPWNATIITGVLKSGLKALSASLVFVFLVLALAGKALPGLLYAGLGLVLVGLVFGLISTAAERQRLPEAQRSETDG